ncbi:MAG TPA: sigma-70 family RNA polymerase sigma factor [Thermomicrobiales bacterium]|nr:sigma-70 family RNA polymerase sigma factor [Thermomicrobiales bacterium]
MGTADAAAMTTAGDEADDDLLVARALGGDRDAFAALIRRYQRPVYGLAYRMLGDAADAEDAAQETFVRAYTRLDSYRPNGRFGSWLLAIAAHWCVDALRARRRRGAAVAVGAGLGGDRFVCPADGPEELALRRASRDEMQALLAQLPPRYQLVLTLRYYHDLSYVELAEALGEPVSTVRMRLFRARAALQRLVEAERPAPVTGSGLPAARGATARRSPSPA